jgi:hypothetical protein
VLKICAALVVASTAWLSADQWQDFVAAPKEPSFYAGKWELAVGQHSVNGPFDRILELKVDGTNLTGTMTSGPRTVRVDGEMTPSFYLRVEPGTSLLPEMEAEKFVGAAWDGKVLLGTYFRGTEGSSRMTGWAARRPLSQ